MAFSYPKDVRLKICGRLLSGESVDALTQETGITAVTLYRWKKQALVDAGRRPGTKSYEVDERDC